MRANGNHESMRTKGGTAAPNPKAVPSRPRYEAESEIARETGNEDRMKYYEFTYKTSFSGDSPVQTGIARVPDNQPLELIRTEVAGALNVGEVTLTSANLESRDLEDQFRRYQEMGRKGTAIDGAYSNLGIVEVVVF
jgi:hypothetical protein